MKQFGFACLGIGIEDLSVEKRVVQLGVEPNRIDLLTSVSGLTFAEAWESRVAGTIDGIEVNYIGREALIRAKIAAGRPKDLIDADALTAPYRKGRRRT